MKKLFEKYEVIDEESLLLSSDIDMALKGIGNILTRARKYEQKGTTIDPRSAVNLEKMRRDLFKMESRLVLVQTLLRTIKK